MQAPPANRVPSESSRARRRRPIRRRRRRLLIETLERRHLLATIQWDGGPMGDGTDWHTPVNWVGDELPGADDDAFIGPAFSGTTITANDNWTIQSVKTSASLTLNGGIYRLLSTGSIVNGELLFPTGFLEFDTDLQIANVAVFGGEVSGSGTTNVVAGAELQLSESARIRTNSSLVVDGIVTVSSAVLGNGAIVVNENGLFQKTGDGLATLAPTVTSAGSIQVDSGTLEFQNTVKATAGSISVGSDAQIVFADQSSGHHELSVDSFSGGSMTIKGGFAGRVEVLRADTFSTDVVLDGGFLDPSTNLSIAELRVEAGGGEVLKSVSPPNQLLTVGTLDVRGAANLSSGVVFQLDEVTIGDQGSLNLLQSSDPTIGRLSIADGTVVIHTSTVDVTDQLTVNGNATIQVGSSAQSIISDLMVDKLQIDPGGALNYELETASSKFETQTLVMSGNSLAGAGLVVQQQMNWNTGMLLPSGGQPGKTTIANGATALVQSATNLNQPVLDGHELINQGTLTIAGHSQFGQLSLKNSSRIENNGSLTFTNNASVGTSDNVVQPDPSTIISGGTVRFSAGSSTTIGTRFLSGGNIFVDGNTTLRGGGFSDSGFNIAAGVTATIAGPAEFRFPNSVASSVTGEGTLRIENQTRLDDGVGVFDVGLLVVAGGRFLIETNLTLPRIDLLGGSIRVVGSTEYVLTVTDRLNWIIGFRENGTIGGAGTTRIPVGATLVNSGQGTAILEDNAKLLVEGTVDLQRGNLRARDIASIDNTKGEFHVRDGAALSLLAGTSMSNAADFFKHGSHLIGLSGIFNNTGTVNVLGGNMTLSGGGTSSGSILLEDDATVQFGQGTAYTLDHSAVDSRLEGGTVDVQAVTTLTGPGAFAPNHLIVRNQFRIDRDISVPRVTTTPFGNQFLGNGVVSVSEQLQADGLRFEEQVGLVIEETATATFGPTFSTYRSSRDIENHGTVNFSGSVINIFTAIVFHNHATIQASGNGGITGTSASRATLVNDGTFLHSGNGFFTISAALSNPGTVNLLAGTTAFSGGGSSTGRVLLDDNATLQVGQGPAFAFNPGLLSGLDGGTVDIQAVTTVSGVGSFAPDKLDVRGTLTLNRDIRIPKVQLFPFGPQVNGTGTLFVSESLNSDGGLFTGGAGLEIEIGATATVGQRSLTFRSSGGLVNRGSLNIPAKSILFQAPATLFNYGTMNIAGGGVIDDQVPGQLAFVQNEGLIHATGGGQFNVNAAVNNLGSIVADNSQINLQRQFVSNYQPATNSLSGGSWIVRQDGNETAWISLHGIAAIRRLSDGAELVLDGPPERAKFTNEASFDILGELEAVTKGSRLELQGKRGLAPAGDSFDMQGELVLGPGSALDLSGNYVSGVNSELTTQLGGAPETELFGKLTAIGTAELAGTFNVEFVDGFGPTQGQLFVPVTYSDLNGDFATIQVPLLGSDRSLEVTRTNTEVQLSALVSASDLRVVSDTIKIPADAMAGDLVTLEYSVENLTSTPAEGDWTDSLYFSRDDQLDAADLLVTRYTHTGGLLGLSEYREVVETTLPVGIDDNYRLIVVADSRGDVPDLDRRNNLGISPTSIAVELQELVLGETVTTTIARGESQAFKLVVPPGKDVLVTADVAHPMHAELLLKFGDVPTRSLLLRSGDFHQRAVGLNDEPLKLGITGRSGEWYVLLYGRELAGDQPLQLTAAEVGLEIVSATPTRLHNLGQTTIAIEGFGFSPDSQVDLVDQSGAEFGATAVYSNNDRHLAASFDLEGVAAGEYQLRVREGGQEALLSRTVRLLDGGSPGELEFEINVTEVVAIREQGHDIHVRYKNVGDTDASSLPVDFRDVSGSPASVLRVPGPGGGRPRLVGSVFFSNSGALQGGMVPPGGEESHRLKFDVQQEVPSPPQLEFTVRTPLTNLDQDHEWNDVRERARPKWIPVDGWDVVFDNFVESVGPTLGHLQGAMGEAMAYLAAQGTPNERLDADSVISFLFAQADNGLANQLLASATDAAVTGPGLPLAFSRYFQQSISSRFRRESGRFTITPAAFGRGWTHTYDYSILDAEDESDPKTVLIQTPTGNRQFEQRTSCTVRDELAQGDEGGECTPPYQEVGGSALFSIIDKELLEEDGTRLIFEPGIFLPLRLRSIVDQHGNSITLERTDDLLTGLSHSNGDRFDLAYNSSGVLTSLTDQAGRETTYTYDAANEHLLSVNGPAGQWSYEYELQSIDSQHALTTITQPDSTVVNYQYDTRGRLNRTSSPGLTPVDIEYDQGRTTYRAGTDLAASIFYDAQGRVVAVKHLNGEMTKMEFDNDGYFSKLVLPGDLNYNFDFSSNGTLYQAITSDGERTLQRVRGQREATEFFFGTPRTYLDGPIYAIEQLIDPLDRKTAFQYDRHPEFANLSGITYPDGAVEEFKGYDDRGSLTEYENRRDQGLRFQYNQRGQITRVDHDDGSFEAYTYDDRDNLLTASGPHGTIELEYDARDRVIRAQYPGDRELLYTYNTNDQLTAIADHAGNVTNYHYDASGRLERLTDAASDLIVAYTYDALGRLEREDQGGGAYTVYAYETTGELDSITHHAADDSMLSQYAYEYDPLDQPTEMRTLDGTWSYSYDAIGQLTHASFASSNPAIADRSLEYVYDATGNRIRTITDGVRENYATNSRNQYTQVGDTTYLYDADGNLTLVDLADPDADDTRYSYDDRSRLVRVERGSDVWQYEYDALGNRIASIHNGQRTEYLVDVIGLSDVIAEYGQNGSLTAFYSHGLGLESQTNGAGDVAYYQFDALGSTVGLTDGGGDQVNRYHYEPYGGQLVAPTEVVVNPFQFVGELGVMQEENGLQFMRARYYSPDAARFINEDPIGHLGGVNLYTYASNSPTDTVDRTGLNPIKHLKTLYTFGKELRAPRGGAKIVTELAGTTEGLFVDSAASVAKQAAKSRWIPRAGTGGGAVPLGIGLGITTATQAKAARFGTKVVTATGHGVPSHFSEALEVFDDFSQGGFSLAFCNFVGCDDLESIVGAAVTVITSRDPNDITGPRGHGPEHYKRDDYAFSYPYTIRFENEDDATAPARRVLITQQLDDDLDWTTFELASFSFGDLFFEIPAGSSFHQQRVDATETLGVYVDFTGQVDMLTGLATWEFQALDPATMDQPIDPRVGFLPPNVTGPEGQGSLSYYIHPKEDLADGQQIDAQASIVFDLNDAIDTNTYVNRIDAATPESQVNPLPATTTTSTFTVDWSGQDGNGSGVASYDVFVSVNNGPFEPWLSDTDLTTADYIGINGSSYAFYSVARDNVDYQESAPVTADTTTTVEVVGTTLDYGDAPTSAQSGFVKDYPVTFAQDGARHVIGPLTLGSNVDAEDNGQPTAGADGDGPDDDGIRFVTTLLRDASDTGSSLLVSSSAAGQLDAWIDFNADGDWEDVGEQIFADVTVQQGDNVLALTIPGGAVVGSTGARFRLSNLGGLSPTGEATNGEVEDYWITLADAAASPSVLIEMVASELDLNSDSGQWVASAASTERFRAAHGSVASFQVVGTATDDTIHLDVGTGVPDQGIVIAGMGGINTLSLRGDGGQLDLADPNIDVSDIKRIDLSNADATSVRLDAAAVARLDSTNNQIEMVAGKDDQIDVVSAADWRMTDPRIDNNEFWVSATHQFGSGEKIEARAAYPWQNFLQSGDVNNDGLVTASDALAIINELADKDFIDSQGNLPDPISVANWPGFYYDKSGDNLATALDALQIINELADQNAASTSEAELVAAYRDEAEEERVIVELDAPTPMVAADSIKSFDLQAPWTAVEPRVTAADSKTALDPEAVDQLLAQTGALLGYTEDL